MYFINYRVEQSKEDYTELVNNLFLKAKDGMPSAYIERRKSAIELFVSDKAAQANQAARRLMSMLKVLPLTKYSSKNS